VPVNDRQGRSYQTYITLTILNFSFTDNYAGYYGGVLYYLCRETATITDSTFRVSGVAVHCGAIYSTTPLELINNTFSKNRATGSGGAIYTTSE